jgi:hypothetical protein
MTGTADHVLGPWRYERIEGAGHWLPLEAATTVDALLLAFLRQLEPAAEPLLAGR